MPFETNLTWTAAGNQARTNFMAARVPVEYQYLFRSALDSAIAAWSARSYIGYAGNPLNSQPQGYADVTYTAGGAQRAVRTTWDCTVTRWQAGAAITLQMTNIQ